MNVLVTGGNGFIGSNLVRTLIKNNHNVFVLSNNSNNIQDLLHKIKYAEFLSNPLKEFLYPLEEKIIEFSPDVVVHCAWAGGNTYEKINNNSQFYDNISTGLKLLNCLKNLNKKIKFVGVGSFSEYGNIVEPAKEEFQENPINFYGLAKYTFKRCSKLFCEENNIDWVWVRPCYVYGKGDVSTRLIPKLIDAFSKNKSVELDECSSILDYLHIDDFTEMFYILIKSKKTGVYNICSGNQYKLKDVINIIHTLLQSKSQIFYNKNNDKKYLPKFICGNNKKILDSVNYKIKYDIKNGLIKTINNI